MKNYFKFFLDKLKKSSNFYFITLLIIGLCGFISVSGENNLNFINALFHPAIILLVLQTSSFVWVIYGFYLKFAKKNITLKGYYKCFILTPILILSIIGQIGNAEAFNILLGTNFYQIFYSTTFVSYVGLAYLIIKK